MLLEECNLVNSLLDIYYAIWFSDFIVQKVFKTKPIYNNHNKMLSYPIDKQKMIVTATMCLRNFIRENHALDRHFRRCDKDPDYVPMIPQDVQVSTNRQGYNSQFRAPSSLLTIRVQSASQTISQLNLIDQRNISRENHDLNQENLNSEPCQTGP